VLIHSFSGNHLLGFPHKHILSGCCGRAGEDPLKHPPYTPHTCFTDSPGFRRMMQRDPALGIIREPRFQPNYVIKKGRPILARSAHHILALLQPKKLVVVQNHLFKVLYIKKK